MPIILVSNEPHIDSTSTNGPLPPCHNHGDTQSKKRIVAVTVHCWGKCLFLWEPALFSLLPKHLEDYVLNF